MLGIYCRISREKKEGKDRSIPDQLKSGIELAEKIDIKYKEYIDEGYSGNLPKTEDRPMLSKMVGDIIKGKITTVYVYDQSRLERNPQVRFLLNEIFKKEGVKLYTSSGIIDLNDMESQMLGDMVSVMNQYYVNLTKKKIKSVLHRNAKEGKAHSSIYPYGYTKDDNNYLIIEEEEAEIVKRVYNDSLNGIGTNKIAENLNTENIPTRYNKIRKGVIRTKNKDTGKITTKEKKDIKWSGNSVRGIIKNTIYKGERKFGGNIYESPVIIEPAYWKKVNDNLVKNRNNSGKKVNHKYLLKGLLECGICGRNMYGRTRENKKDHYYMCSSKRLKELKCSNRSINIDFIEKFIWEVVLEDVYVVNELEKEGNQDNKIENLKKEKTLVEKEISSLSKEIDKINNLAIKNVLDDNEVIKEKKSRNVKIDENQAILNNIINDINFELKAIKLRRTIGFDKDKIKEDTPYNKRRELIFKYISRIFIKYNESIKFYYISVNFNTKTGEQNYAFSSNRNRMKKFVETGENYLTNEEKELIAGGIEINEGKLTEYLERNESSNHFSTKR
jgi:DNA invertase Pin-like site-specific DNA recombinase